MKTALRLALVGVSLAALTAPTLAQTMGGQPMKHRSHARRMTTAPVAMQHNGQRGWSNNGWANNGWSNNGRAQNDWIAPYGYDRASSPDAEGAGR